MNKLRLISRKTVSILTLFLMVISLCANAQNEKKMTMMKDCCMMKDGKMMVVKDGKMMPMENDMVMRNGTTCKTTGECIMRDGQKMMMKEGDCMEMSGKMCADTLKKVKITKTTTKTVAMKYCCSMHPKVTSATPGKCSKCGMDLVKKTK